MNKSITTQPTLIPADQIEPGNNILNPIPDPNIAAAWKEILPNAPERILNDFEEERQHARWKDQLKIKTQRQLALLGLTFAMIMTLACFIAAVFFLVKGDYSSSAFFWGSTLLGLIALFISLAKSFQVSR